MAETLERPDWYNEDFYSKKRTPEEWLYEIWKRDKFNRDDLGFPFSIRLLSAEKRKKCFQEIIFLNDIKEFLSGLQATPSQPIKHLTVSDVFRMANMISNSDWYKSQPDRELFESAIASMTNGTELSKDQKIAFNKFYDTPWCAFHEKSNDKTWYPNKDMIYLSGIPISLDPGYAKKDIINQLKSKLTRWVGKLQDIELKFNTWQDSNILAVFDLMTWFRIQDIEYSKIALFKLIWPQGRLSMTTKEYVNPDDDIDHSISLVVRVISRDVIRTLAVMCEARKHREQITPA
jgi:hypothetical protein